MLDGCRAAGAARTPRSRQETRSRARAPAPLRRSAMSQTTSPVPPISGPGTPRANERLSDDLPAGNGVFHPSFVRGSERRPGARDRRCDIAACCKNSRQDVVRRHQASEKRCHEPPRQRAVGQAWPGRGSVGSSRAEEAPCPHTSASRTDGASRHTGRNPSFARQAEKRQISISTISSRTTPRGTSTSTTSPTCRPSNAEPTGDA